MSYMRCALVCAVNAEVSLRPGGLDFFTGLPVQAGVEVCDWSVVDNCELQRRGKTWQEFAGLVLGNDRGAFVSQKSRNRLLSKPGVLSGYPKSVQLEISSSSHACSFRIGKQAG
jgi:hypothetical protein